MNTVSRPNVLVVVFDSLSQTAFENLAGGLPSLSALRDGSLQFLNAYVCSPESGPACASLFTGLDMAAHGVWTDGVVLPTRETPFPEQFALNGFETWLVGRRQLAGASNWTTEHARPREFHHFEWAHGPLHRSRQNAYLAWLQDIAPDTYQQIFPSQPNPDDTDIPVAQREAVMGLPDDLSFNSWAGNRVCARIAASDAPFLGVASFVVGETMGARPDNGARTEGLNPRALRQADAALGKILQELPQDTVVVVTAGRGSLATDELAQPLSEAAIKVPLMICADGQTAQIVEQAVSTFDIARTLYEIAKIPPPQRVQGVSLFDCRPRGWALARLRNPDQPHQTALRADTWKLVMIHGDPDTGTPPDYRLFDLSADPSEGHDLASTPEHQPRLEVLMDLMIDARVALEDRTEPRIAKF